MDTENHYAIDVLSYVFEHGHHTLDVFLFHKHIIMLFFFYMTPLSSILYSTWKIHRDNR